MLNNLTVKNLIDIYTCYFYNFVCRCYPYKFTFMSSSFYIAYHLCISTTVKEPAAFIIIDLSLGDEDRDGGDRTSAQIKRAARTDSPLILDAFTHEAQTDYAVFLELDGYQNAEVVNEKFVQRIGDFYTIAFL